MQSLQYWKDPARFAWDDSNMIRVTGIINFFNSNFPQVDVSTDSTWITKKYSNRTKRQKIWVTDFSELVLVYNDTPINIELTNYLFVHKYHTFIERFIANVSYDEF